MVDNWDEDVGGLGVKATLSLVGVVDADALLVEREVRLPANLTSDVEERVATAHSEVPLAATREVQCVGVDVGVPGGTQLRARLAARCA